MNSNKQLVTITFWQFEGSAKRWWAFRQMGFGAGRWANFPGVRFAKMLGSGGGNGFSIKPNWGQYGLLIVWENEQAATDFFNTNDYWQTFRQKSDDQFTVHLHPLVAHGEWDAQNPFKTAGAIIPDRPVAVLTRATIKLSKLHRFWAYVPRVSASLDDMVGCVFSVGVGEYPLFQQATFSMWQSAKQMQHYAYSSSFHREVVQKTRELGWYSEELFARFEIAKVVGREFELA